VKRQIPQAAYEQHVALMTVFLAVVMAALLKTGEISEALRALRGCAKFADSFHHGRASPQCRDLFALLVIRIIPAGVIRIVD
jgi:hypothetical protein